MLGKTFWVAYLPVSAVSLPWLDPPLYWKSNDLAGKWSKPEEMGKRKMPWALAPWHSASGERQCSTSLSANALDLLLLDLWLVKFFLEWFFGVFFFFGFLFVLLLLIQNNKKNVACRIHTSWRQGSKEEKLNRVLGNCFYVSPKVISYLLKSIAVGGRPKICPILQH